MYKCEPAWIYSPQIFGPLAKIKIAARIFAVDLSIMVADVSKGLYTQNLQVISRDWEDSRDSPAVHQRNDWTRRVHAPCQEQTNAAAEREYNQQQFARKTWFFYLSLQEEINNSKKHLLYLIDVHIFSEDDINLNTKTLRWPINIKPVFEQNTEIVEVPPQCQCSS